MSFNVFNFQNCTKGRKAERKFVVWREFVIFTPWLSWHAPHPIFIRIYIFKKIEIVYKYSVERIHIFNKV